MKQSLLPVRLESKTACLWLTAMTLAVFWPIVTHGFIGYDDPLYVTANPHVRAGLHPRMLAWAFTTADTYNWYPLTWISHMTDAQIFGLRPWGHHLTSLLLHMANVLLLFLALRRMTSAAWRSALAAAVFAIHPLQVESVAWVAERKNLLSSFFCLLALWNYAAYVERPARKRYAAILVSFSAALMSKAPAVTLPCLLLVMDYWPLKRLQKGWRPLVAEKTPLFALAAAAGIIALVCTKERITPLADLPFGLRMANAALSVAAYLQKTLWPSGLAVYYPHPRGTLSIALAVGSTALLAGLSLALIRLRNEKPFLLAGWLWFLTALAPMLGLIQVGGQAMADRYAYIPLIGLSIMAAWTIPFGPRRGSRATVLGAAATVAALMVAAGLQVRYWRDDVALFQHALEIQEASHVAHYHLACGLLFERARLDGLVGFGDHAHAGSLE